MLNFNQETHALGCRSTFKSDYRHMYCLFNKSDSACVSLFSYFRAKSYTVFDKQ